jgi:capsular polysaccharide biosynthesis protein
MINWEKMAQEMQTDPAYLRELLFVDMDYDSNSVSLNVYHEDEAAADQILGEILGQLEAFASSDNGHLDKYSITIVNRNTSQHVNITNASDKEKSSLLDVQKNVRDSITTAQKNLTDRQKLLKDLTEPSRPASSSLKTILKSGIKFGIIGLVLGICLAGFCYCLIFILDSKVYSAEDMKDQFGILVLGTLPMAERTGLFSFVDKILERIEGTSYRPAENLVYERAAVNLKNYVEGSGSETIAETSVIKKILVTGTCGAENSAAVAAKLDSFLKEDQGNRIELIAGSDLCDDTDTLRKLASCDGMILVEKRSQSRFNAIRNEIELAESLKKSVYGCIVL